MNKKILLVEPAYKTKYPPLGLMKLSTYHKMSGDQVSFVKGKSKEALNKYWDRIYITTLFTWTWNETIETINFYHEGNTLFPTRCFVGGILASLMPDDLYNATGIYPVIGLLDNSRKIEQKDNINIDELPLDYDILKEVENQNFHYNYTDAYLGYSTRGCVRNCAYCAVKVLEPNYDDYINVKKMIQRIDEKSNSEKKKHLLLMDNNVLASKRFDKIIDDIKAAGFSKEANVQNKKKLTVDFNQGLDARLLTEHKMKRLSEIPLDPMRIAFDDIRLKKIYINAIKLAHKYGQRNMSNYILYNYKDTPEDFYERLKINIKLNEEFRKNGNNIHTTIYSFPMRYIPINAKRRDVETNNSYWNRRYLRSVKAILNVTKGPVMPGSEFFHQAFGENINEFKAILSMPDRFIINRLTPRWKEKKSQDRLAPYVKKWLKVYSRLTQKETDELLDTLCLAKHQLIKEKYDQTKNKKIRQLLYYELKADEIVSGYIREKKHK